MLKSLIEVLHSNVTLIGLLIGSVTPLLTSVIQQPKWSRQARVTVAVAVSVVVGFALAAADGQLDPSNLFSVVIAVLVSAEAFYQKLWKASGISGAIEQVTTLRARKAGPDQFEVCDFCEYGCEYGCDDDEPAEADDEPDGLEHK